MKELFTNFCKETLIHGFAYVGGSQKLWKVVLYATVVLVSVIMMIRDAFFLFNKYSTEPTKVDLTVMHNNTFSLGQPTVCFFPATYDYIETSTYGFSAFDIDYFQFNLMNASATLNVHFQDSKDALVETLSPYSYNFSRYAEYLKGLNDTDLRHELEANADIFAALYHVLSIVIVREHQLMMGDVSVENILNAGDAESLRQFLIEKNVDFKEVRDFLGLISCLKANFSYSVFYSSQSKRVKLNEISRFCRTAKLSFAGITDITGSYDQLPKFCFHIPIPIELHKSLDFMMLSSYVPNHNTVDPNNCIISLDFAGNDGYFSGNSQSSVINVCNVQQTVKLSIVSDIISYNTARKPCRVYNRLACLLRCQQESFMSNCNCFPLRLVLGVSKPLNVSDCYKLPLMNVTAVLVSEGDKYAAVLRQFCTANVTDVDRCEPLCPAECSTRQFMFNYGQAAHGEQFLLETKIFVSTFVYPQFVESPLLTWSDVLMAFGGSIGFWLGASIVAFVHAVIFFLSGLIAAAFHMGVPK